MRDFGLVIRMVLVALLTPVVVLGALFWVLTTVTIWQAQVTLVIALGVGICVIARDKIAISSRGGRLSVADAPQLHAIVERLCVVADLSKPTIVLERRALPNSWVEGTVRGGYRLHLTQGLLDLLEPSELEAVIAHELAHVINHDAAVMTVVGGPGEALLQGGARMTCQGWPLMLGGLLATAIGWTGTLGTRALSRYREFAADAGAVALTGNPAALAAALMKVSDGLVATPKADLREAAALDSFHLLPTAEERRFGLPPTHPPLRARVERLERLERHLQQH